VPVTLKAIGFSGWGSYRVARPGGTAHKVPRPAFLAAGALELLSCRHLSLTKRCIQPELGDRESQSTNRNSADSRLKAKLEIECPGR
jgi:hypothetical protein